MRPQFGDEKHPACYVYWAGRGKTWNHKMWLQAEADKEDALQYYNVKNSG